MRHSLSDINGETATCSVCGPETPLKPNYRGGFRCRNKFNENRNIGRVAGTHKYDNEKRYGGERRSLILQRLLPLQDNKCAICMQTFVRAPHVDHDHETGQVRGLLCGPCNTGIGMFRDQVGLLRNAVLYLQ